MSTVAEIKAAIAAETHEAIHIQQIEPRHDVLAFRRGGLVQAVEKFARFHIRWRALFSTRS